MGKVYANPDGSRTAALSPVIKERQATYAGALDGRDLALELVGLGVEEKVILADEDWRIVSS